MNITGTFLVFLDISFSLVQPGTLEFKVPWVTAGDLIEPQSIETKIYDQISHKQIFKLPEGKVITINSEKIYRALSVNVPILKIPEHYSERQYVMSFRPENSKMKLAKQCQIIMVPKNVGETIQASDVKPLNCSATQLNEPAKVRYDPSRHVVRAKSPLKPGDNLGQLYVKENSSVLPKGKHMIFRKKVGSIIIEKPVEVHRTTSGNLIPVFDANDNLIYADIRSLFKDYE